MKMNENRHKVVFKEADKIKVAYGFVTFEHGFVKVSDGDRYILINKNDIVFIRSEED